MPLSRKKACVGCRESKTRCNQALPTCSRCLDKNVRCVYDSNRVAPYPQPTARPAQRRQATPVLHPEFVDGILTRDITLADFSDESTPASIWTSTNNGMDAHFITESALSDSIPSNIIEEVERTFDEDLWLLRQAENARKNDSMRIVTFDGGSMTEQAYSRRRIGGQEVLASVILGQLKSYPRMLIEGHKLPPFIHAPCHLNEELGSACAASGRHVCFSKELSICASLVQMFYSRNPNNSQFVWKTIHDEGERIIQRYATFTPQEQLAGLQSVIILLLLQAEDPASVEQTGGLFLVTIVTGLAGQLTRYSEWRSEPAHERPRRADWVWRESIRRSVLTLSVIDILLEGMIGPGGSRCDSSEVFQRSALPCGRDLWEARNTRVWIDSYDRLIASEGKLALLTIQDLVVSIGEGEWLDSSLHPYDGQDRQLAVMRWCESMDALGTLLWMSLPLHLSVVKHEARKTVLNGR